MKYSYKNRMKKILEALKKDNIEEINLKRAIRKTIFLGSAKENFKLLINMLKDYWNGDFDIPKTDLIILIGTISYVAMPLDAIPDFIIFSGFIDDIAAVNLVISKIKKTFNRYKEFIEEEPKYDF